MGSTFCARLTMRRNSQRALDAGCDLIGVNSRNLRTFEVDLGTAFRLAELMPKEVLGTAESGIQSAADLIRLRAAGYQAFLIGESLMKTPSPGETLRACWPRRSGSIRSEAAETEARSPGTRATENRELGL